MNRLNHTYMSKQIITCVLFILLLILEARSQCDTLHVFHISGRAFIQKDQITHDISKGELLIKPNIMLKDHSQVILFNRNGTSIVLDQGGFYSYADIQERCQTPKFNLLGRYLDFIWNGLTEKKVEGNQKVQAAISRGEEILMELPFDSTIILSNEIFFSWKSEPEHLEYLLEIRDPNNRKVLVKDLVNDTFYLWIPEPTSIISNEYYSWVVTTEAKIPTNIMRYTFMIADTTWKAGVNLMLTTLEQTKIDDLIINELVRAKFFEENYLYLEAYQSYMNLLKEYPGQKEANALLNRFLNKFSSSQKSEKRSK